MRPTVTADRLSRDPHPLLAEIRSKAAVCWIPDLDCWLVTGYQEAVDVMRDSQTFTVDHPGFSTQQVIGPSMLSLDGAAHRLHRDPFAAPFRLQAIRSDVADWIEQRADELVERVEPAARGDLRQAVARPLAVETMAHILGLVGINGSDLVEWYEAIVEAVHAVTLGADATVRGKEAFTRLSAAVVASLRHSPLLISAQSSGDLTPEEIASNVAVLLFGGIVTGDGTNCLVLQRLLEQGDLIGRIGEDPELASGSVDEALRLEPAAAAVDRYASRDVDLGTVRVSSGDLVRVSLSAANRDPEVFADPNEFRLDRGNVSKHLTFARGPHSCLGVHVARAEALATVNAVARRLDRPALEDVVAPEGLIFRGLERLPVKWGQLD